jgi:hydroxypyruvate reductase
MLVIGPRSSTPPSLPPDAEWCGAGHPLPDENSLAGARRALEIARDGSPGDALVVLLSGGGSALMALPAPGLTLEAKQDTARTLMQQGADIHELNTVRKHLSAIKGGRLAVAARGSVVTLAVSDVVGDDLSVIASGPTIADDTTYADALAVLSRRGGRSAYREEVVTHLERGRKDEILETPKTGDARLARAVAFVIGRQRGAIEGARRAAARLGYHVHVVNEPITGEAREAGRSHIDVVSRAQSSLPRPLCIISSGETTVTVVGKGTGGRNQEFALAMAQSLEAVGPSVVAASIGTDGIDGPTDAAGAVVDSTTLSRALRSGLAPETYFADNNTYEFFDRLGDLIRTGPTNTNVGDLQVVLVGT